MTSIESINEKLQAAAENLQQVLREIQALPLEPTELHIRSVADALAQVHMIQFEIYDQRPDLQPAAMNEEIPARGPGPDTGTNGISQQTC